MTRKLAPVPETAALTAVYARISEVDNDDTPTRGRTDGVDRQVADAVALCERSGWPHLAPFVDNDFSASDYATKVRPGYQEMMRLVRAGEVGRIVCWDIDRLYRRMKELEELIELATAGRVSIVSMYGDLDLSTGDGRFVARSLVNMAQKSSDDTSRRIRRQRQALRDRGIAKGGRTAFGWADPMTPHPVEAKLVVAAMHAVLAGESLVGIARAWEAKGVPTKQGGEHWDQARVSQILTNPRHIGRMTHRGDDVGPAAWPAIVDRETFERVTATLKSRSAHLYGISHAHRPLSGVLVCGSCGNSLSRSQNNGVACWRCFKRPGAGCNGVSVKAEHLDPRVYEALFAYVDTVKLAQLVDAGAGDVKADVVAELAALERRADEYLDMLDSGELDRRGYARLRQRLLADQAALTNRLARSEHSVLTPYVGRPGRLQKAWPDLSVDRQRAIIQAALGPIEVRGTTRRRLFDPDRVRFRGGQTMTELLEAAS
jgi:DNA invertase Pin-like site-specific DNA recombinase